ncbi:alpha-1D adrenergic receptor-like [Oculina patagonica]
MASNASNISSANCMFLDTNQRPFRYISTANVIACILNALFSLIATSSNAIVLISFWKTPSLQTPQNSLLGWIAFSDLLVGAVVQPLDVAQRVMEELGDIQIYCSVRLAKNTLAWIISSVSFCILTTISVERLVALLKPLKHTKLITHPRIMLLVAFYWVFCTSVNLARFAGLPNKAFFGMASFIVFINLTINVVSYLKIFKVIKLHQRRINDEVNLSNRLHGQMAATEMRRFKTFTLTAVYIVTLVILFYVPFICYLVAYTILGFIGPVKLAYICIETLSYVNSSVNPFVYSYRLRSIRQAIYKTLSKSYSLNRGTSYNGETALVSTQSARNVAFNTHL